MKRLLICGDRHYRNYHLIYDLLWREREEISCVIQGEARGADKMAKSVGIVLGIPHEDYPADWEMYGRSAGPIRNREQYHKGKPDEVWGFHEHITQSSGTLDMLNYAHSHGTPCYIFYGKTPAEKFLWTGNATDVPTGAAE